MHSHIFYLFQSSLIHIRLCNTICSMCRMSLESLSAISIINRHCPLGFLKNQLIQNFGPEMSTSLKISTLLNMTITTCRDLHWFLNLNFFYSMLGFLFVYHKKCDVPATREGLCELLEDDRYPCLNKTQLLIDFLPQKFENSTLR